MCPGIGGAVRDGVAPTRHRVPGITLDFFWKFYIPDHAFSRYSRDSQNASLKLYTNIAVIPIKGIDAVLLQLELELELSG